MEEKLPAVSCSSGKLIIEEKTEDVERQYPGRAFEDESLSYVQAMNEFVSAFQTKVTSSPSAFQSPEMRENGTITTQKKLLHREEAQLRDTRRAVRIQRKEEDVAWKQLKAQRRVETEPTQFFVEGSKVTAVLIVDALQEFLLDHLRFLMTDRGPQFKAEIFKELLKSRHITHIFIAKLRPQSNGIAERFVRTIKEWLKGKNWENVQELTQLIHLFIQEYNDRPHQGLPISGLSPNEFAERLANVIFKEQNSI